MTAFYKTFLCTVLAASLLYAGGSCGLASDPEWKETPSYELVCAMEMNEDGNMVFVMYGVSDINAFRASQERKYQEEMRINKQHVYAAPVDEKKIAIEKGMLRMNPGLVKAFIQMQKAEEAVKQEDNEETQRKLMLARRKYNLKMEQRKFWYESFEDLMGPAEEIKEYMS